MGRVAPEPPLLCYNMALHHSRGRLVSRHLQAERVHVERKGHGNVKCKAYTKAGRRSSGDVYTT
jgi:hypothetical protein